jgi:hypothetical protein
MTRITWIVLASIATLAVLAAMGLAGYLLFELPRAIGSITVNGRVLDLQQAHLGHFLLATMGVLLALAIVLVVVPTVVLLALAVPLMLAAFGLAVAGLAAALVLSPLILLIWWLWKRSRNPGTMAT